MISKKNVLSVLALTMIAAPAFADCADNVKSAVESTAAQEFDEALVAQVPAFEFDGGRWFILHVPVVRASEPNKTVAVYTAQVDEVCRVDVSLDSQR